MNSYRLGLFLLGSYAMACGVAYRTLQLGANQEVCHIYYFEALTNCESARGRPENAGRSELYIRIWESCDEHLRTCKNWGAFTEKILYA